ncbi:uncharacterized protein I303_108666 [Kwoniella dejecticola CBS 10117]|uniref:Uncharacterized protein n=1 Tax=Kwoniella dejecticola CBS 10117 TaxID=1296121 RepID=A0A1A5ZWR1_9TREE|nr:uncharacterized protein I303_07009 [Kwoniella dejecticola CBS 10117]OBR82250.1 hypothetical protein I303_07009 [Kwoniella dejecticola CBS 10117]
MASLIILGSVVGFIAYKEHKLKKSNKVSPFSPSSHQPKGTQMSDSEHGVTTEKISRLYRTPANQPSSPAHIPANDSIERTHELAYINGAPNDSVSISTLQVGKSKKHKFDLMKRFNKA